MTTSMSNLVQGIKNYCLYVLICVFVTLNFVYAKVVRAISATKEENDGGVPEQEKLVVITGCDAGFGRLLVERLVASTDLNILALTLKEESAKELVEKLGAGPKKEKLFAMKCDVTSDADIESMKARTEELCSRDSSSSKLKLYAIVNNAGSAMASGDFMFFEKPDKFMQVMDVNFFGMLRVTSALQKPLVTSRCNGRVINLSSVCGAVSTPTNGGYSASKFAVEAWSDALSVEYKSWGVHVVKIRPGQFNTAIQGAWAKNCRKNYSESPEWVKALYGGDAWVDSLAKAGQSITSTKIPEPDELAQLLESVLFDPSPKPCYWGGNDANTFFKALASLPQEAALGIKENIHVKPVTSTKDKAV
mmetsp:Transcript_27198/g.39834  ORF Transcript_27198/g.39834 Transcript_27198/m.39834 type:complete len:362 (-) Transcript_27198:89-1174(-)|eukprot:CAMPEP_0194037148 /NCGR_PEP_ID=MMETSP0009_2-20130614/9488_1 /TAXON_ID=210454 /ORGANISM="Grammatophora oceanica, Strain CCMP 410" /LENGTH=361 /DNA_ID=CAMNT_0038679187 /DNA_START=1 /DNA_END=1086 /DNA_ORIENTATION=-